MRIAVDAMGGDNAPDAIVEGVVDAVRETKELHVILVGDREILRALLERHKATKLPISVKHTTEVVGMHESPTIALRKKKDSSIRVAFDMVKAGEARAAVSAGNSGAAMAVATMVLKRLPGVERPAIATVLPALNGRTLVLDVGANIDVTPSQMVQFAIMGETFARDVLGFENPRVGVLSNGQEDSKGTDLTRAVNEALRSYSSMNYIGYVEGRDIFTGDVDVVVTDGFTGNVVLKAAQGLAKAIAKMIRDEVGSGLVAKVGYVLSRGAFRRLKRRTDYAEVGGAPLLGVNGIGIVAHGSSGPRAIKNAIYVAKDFADKRVNLHLMQVLEQNQELQQLGAGKGKRFWTNLKDKIIHPKKENDDEEG